MTIFLFVYIHVVCLHRRATIEDGEHVGTTCSILEPFKLSVYIARNLSPWYRKLPDIDVTGKLCAVKVGTLARHLFNCTIRLAPDLLPSRLHSSVVEHRTGIAKVMGSNPVGASEFLLGFICNCLIYFTTANIFFTSILYPQITHKIMIFIIYTSRHSPHTTGIN